MLRMRQPQLPYDRAAHPWVGIQRFDEETNFGIDLIRNGRTIRVAEKSAFFEYADELGSLTKDYPIDQQYGRIVGSAPGSRPRRLSEAGLPAQYPEWEQAMAFLRGASSLQPNKPGADQNASPVFELYQGYRKVRNVASATCTWGSGRAGAEKARRVSRDVEHEYYARFRAKEQGYYDDAEWWKLVEVADTRPMEELVQCPMCHVDNLKSIELCEGCGYALIGHDCANCGERIPSSAGLARIALKTRSRRTPRHGRARCAEIRTRTTWMLAASASTPRHAVPGITRVPRGTVAARPGSLHRGSTVTLADGSSSQPLNVKVHRTCEHITPTWGGAPVPLVALRDTGLTVFLDPRHAV